MDTHEIRRDRPVPVGEIKRFAHNRLPPGSLRDLILSEPDELPASELAIKISVYLKLLSRHGGSDI
jgi:hypothetical protein